MPRVLVIDDDPDMASLLGQMAQMTGYEPTVVKSSQAVLGAAIETAPDVILLDVMMAGTDGWTIYRQLREITDAPVIFITAWHTAENAEHARELGEAFMTKPLSPTDLSARLRAVLGRSGPAA